MKIEFESKKVEAFFTDWSFTLKKCGLQICKQVKKRYYELKSSGDLSILLSLGIGNPHMLKGNFFGYLSIDISGNMRLLARVVGYSETQSFTENMKLDYIIIKGVCDDHGGKYEWIIP